MYCYACASLPPGRNSKILLRAMRRPSRLKHLRLWSMGAVATTWQGPAFAHSFGQVYTLPVPFRLYASAASATLIISFAVAAMFAPATPKAGEVPERPWRAVPAWLLTG